MDSHREAHFFRNGLCLFDNFKFDRKTQEHFYFSDLPTSATIDDLARFLGLLPPHTGYNHTIQMEVYVDNWKRTGYALVIVPKNLRDSILSKDRSIFQNHVINVRSETEKPLYVPKKGWT